MRLPRRPMDDDGAAAIAVIALSSVLVVALVVAVLVTDLVAARQRAAAAADLGALAGAPAAQRSESDACLTAAWVVRENGATLRRCSVVDGDVWITASARPRAPWARWLAWLAAGAPEPAVTARAGLR